MSSIGTGYDLAAATFSPDGRIFQVEYAQKAVDNSGTVIAIRGKDGVLMATDKLLHSKLNVEMAIPRIVCTGEHIACALAGVYPDCRALLDFANGEAMKYLKDYRAPIPVRQLANQLAEYVHIYTLGISRPFGASVFFAAWDKKNGSKLYLIDPSGCCFEYRAWAVGKHRQMAKTEIEKMHFELMTVKDLLKEAARIIFSIREEQKTKDLRIEMGWIGEGTNGKFEHVPDELIREAEDWARTKIEEAEMED